MRIAVTGSSGGIGSRVCAQALALGHSVVGIDIAAAPTPGVTSVTADISDYDALVTAFRGCDALVHLAAIPVPFRLPDHQVHANNVVGSYNAMRAAIEVGVRRICQASSVNATGLSFSRVGTFDYFPLDEAHPCHAEDAYSLSKWVCEQQADSLARRYEDVAIASLRFHWVVPRARAEEGYGRADAPTARHLWGHTDPAAAADACLRAVSAPFRGHEVFYIVAPSTVIDIRSRALAARFYPGVPVRGDLDGTRAFFDCGKAERMLGWVHPAG
jgi:nucleoside-diphosphate-sugar epimerase